MIIIGAGMAGLLAAGMLRDDAEAIWETQSDLPNNHSALLRFRSSVVGDVLGITFKKVSVMKAVDAAGMNPIAAMLSYSRKTNGTATMRSSISANGEIEERYIGPTDLVSQMARKVSAPIEFGKTFGRQAVGPRHFISTLPMPVLMKILDWQGSMPTFRSVGGYNINAQLVDVDAYATLYVPDKERSENRISITGNRLTIETSLPQLSESEIDRLFLHWGPDGVTTGHRNTVSYALELLGIRGIGVHSISVTRQRYAKILPIEEGQRRDFIIWASESRNIFSFGRFATWRPGLLMDDLVNDVRVIQRLANGGNSYEHRKR